jgi:hypothetical protein
MRANRSADLKVNGSLEVRFCLQRYRMYGT